jgi:hypothetical protein
VAGLRVARVQVQDRGAGLGGGDRLLGDFARAQREVRICDGMWIAPVIAQLMIVLRGAATSSPSCRPSGGMRASGM